MNPFEVGDRRNGLIRECRAVACHKATLAVPGKMTVLSDRTYNCNMTKPYLTDNEVFL